MDGTSRLFVEHSSGINKATFCSTGERILIDNKETTGKYSIQNLVTGKIVGISPSPNQYYCSVEWWGNRCDALLAYPSSILDSHGGCWSYPVLIDMNGNSHVVGTSAAFPYYDAAVSPSGAYLAYSDRGHPLLYHWGNGSTPLNFDKEVFPGCSYGFYYPSWSSDSSKVAWAVTGYMNGPSVEGIAIYDLSGNKFTFLYPFSALDSYFTNMAWDPKQDYLMVHSRGNRLSVIKPDGTELFYVDKTVWQYLSPDGAWIAYGVYTNTGTIAYIISSDGQELHELSTSLNFTHWSPDSRYLVYQDRNGYVMVQTGEWVPYRLHLPSGAKLMDWVVNTP